MQRAINDWTVEGLASVRRAALDQQPIAGLTHRFYRYPARFSPIFARACIEAFSKPGQVVLDPYMGGGTTVLEAMVTGRRAIGSDINTLSVFVARAKTSPLNRREEQALNRWATEIVPNIRCHDSKPAGAPTSGRVPKNMASPEARWLKKTIALCLASSIGYLPTPRARAFARCILLNVGQWALNGRSKVPSAAEFRKRVVVTTREMLSGAADLSDALIRTDAAVHRPLLRQNDAEHIDRDLQIQTAGPVDLVVTSPPYPGVHMLYHRWQVDGRKETDAPYWIASCTDGSGASYYNFASRDLKTEDRYFEKAERSFGSVRQVMRRGAVLAQMVSFSDPERQLRRYLVAMQEAGFEEMRKRGGRRTWREVPSRRWHANLKGELASGKEVVLLHRAA